MGGALPPSTSPNLFQQVCRDSRRIHSMLAVLKGARPPV
jgi:hypothetical protein